MATIISEQLKMHQPGKQAHMDQKSFRTAKILELSCQSCEL